MEGKWANAHPQCACRSSKGGGGLGRRGKAFKIAHEGDVQCPEGIFCEHEEEQKALISILITTVGHFFGSFRSLFGKVKDPRDQRRRPIAWPLSPSLAC